MTKPESGPPSRENTAIFHGPHAYVSSKWYEAANVVPTWNYIAVHVSGILLETDGSGLGRILDLMLEKHEGDAQAFYRNLDESVRGVLEKQIMGVKLAIGNMEGMWKLSQNMSRDAREKIVSGLAQSGNWNSGQVAEIMRARLEAEGS